MDRIGSATTRPTQDDGLTCKDGDSNEDAEATRQANDRAARERLDHMIDHGPPDVVGQSDAHATCSVVAEAGSTHDWTAQQKAAAYTARIDKPLADDPVGNALVGVAAGGAIAGVEAAAATPKVTPVMIDRNLIVPRAVPKPPQPVASAGTTVAKGIAKAVAKDAASRTLRNAQAGPWQPRPAAEDAPPPKAAPPASDENRSNASGTSEPEPRVSRPPPPADRVPYAPGQAPPITCASPLRC